MSVTLNTQLEELMFSSQIPDLDLTTSDDNEAVVSIVSGGATGIPELSPKLHYYPSLLKACDSTRIKSRLPAFAAPSV